MICDVYQEYIYIIFMSKRIPRNVKIGEDPEGQGVFATS